MKISKVAELFVDFLTEYSKNGFLNIKEFMKILSLEGVSEDLINDCIEGCLRHFTVINKVIDLFINSLDYTKGSRFLKDTRITNTLRALYYLLVFEINNIGINQFETIVIHFLNSTVLEFLKFVSNPNNVSGALQNQWLELYDQLFVENIFLTPMLRLGPDLASIIQKTEVILLQRKKPKIKSKPTTIPKPFNFTATQAERPSKPIDDSSQFITQAAQKQNFKKKPEISSQFKIETLKSKSANRLSKSSQLIGLDKNARYLQPRKSDKTLHKIAVLLEEREKELQFDKPKICELPVSFEVETPVKQNTVTLLREAALVKKTIEEQMKKLENLEQGTIEGAQFEKRLEEIRNEEEERMTAIQNQNRLKGLLSREEALLAKQTAIEEKKKQVQQFKVEMEENAKESNQLRQDNEERSKILVQQVIESETRTKEAMKKIVHQKRDIVNKMQNSMNNELNKAKEDENEMMKRRRLLVNEIRALKLESAQLRKSSNQRLDNMSLDQLHEHLELLRKWKKESEEEKRAQILESKKSRAEKLNQVKEFIEQFRQRKTEEHKKGQEKKELPAKYVRERSKNVEVISLEKKLEEIKAQRIKLETKSACTNDGFKKMRDNQLDNAKNKFLKLF